MIVNSFPRLGFYTLPRRRESNGAGQGVGEWSRLRPGPERRRLSPAGISGYDHGASNFNLYGDAMITRCSLWGEAPVLGWLQGARAVGRAHNEYIPAWLCEVPIETPQHPCRRCATIIDAGFMPYQRIIETDLDPADAACSGKGNALQRHRGPHVCLNRLAGRGLIKARFSWDHKVWPPALPCVKAFDVVIGEFDACHPLDVLLPE